MLAGLVRRALVVAEDNFLLAAEHAALGVHLLDRHLHRLLVGAGERRADAAERVDLTDLDRRLRGGGGRQREQQQTGQRGQESMPSHAFLPWCAAVTIRGAAACTALRMPWYPVQRQSTADRPSRTSASVGSGLTCRRSSAVISMPGVQKPHCRPWCSRNASCSGWSTPSRIRPSMVTSSAPSACTASIRHERAASPLTRIVQAPQMPCSQPTWVPVSARSSRRKSTSNF